MSLTIHFPDEEVTDLIQVYMKSIEPLVLKKLEELSQTGLMEKVRFVGSKVKHEEKQSDVTQVTLEDKMIDKNYMSPIFVLNTKNGGADRYIDALVSSFSLRTQVSLAHIAALHNRDLNPDYQNVAVSYRKHGVQRIQVCGKEYLENLVVDKNLNHHMIEEQKYLDPSTGTLHFYSRAYDTRQRSYEFLYNQPNFYKILPLLEEITIDDIPGLVNEFNTPNNNKYEEIEIYSPEYEMLDTTFKATVSFLQHDRPSLYFNEKCSGVLLVSKDINRTASEINPSLKGIVERRDTGHKDSPAFLLHDRATQEYAICQTVRALKFLHPEGKIIFLKRKEEQAK